MTPQETPLDRLRRAFSQPQRGAAGLADELLALSGEFVVPLSLSWCNGHCLIELADGDAAPVREAMPLPRSVFRALLARIATLGSDQTAGAFTPHGGRGQLIALPHFHAVLNIALTNTPDGQSLEITPERPDPKIAFRLPAVYLADR